MARISRDEPYIKITASDEVITRIVHVRHIKSGTGVAQYFDQIYHCAFMHNNLLKTQKVIG